MIVIPSIISILIAILCTKSASGSLLRPPSIEKQPLGFEIPFQVSRSRYETDNPLTLYCEASGNPEPKFCWIKNGLPFDYVTYGNRIIQKPDSGTLVFTKLETIDEGLYQCFAENIHGTSLSNTVFLRKSELNLLVDEVRRKMIVVEGQPITLECNPPTGYPKPVISWIIISSSGNRRAINNSRLTVDPEGQLHFSNVTTEDMIHDGMYACIVYSPFLIEFKIVTRIILTVKSSGSGQKRYAPVKHYVSPPNIQVLRGHQLELHCIYGGTPLPDISWYKRGGILEGSRFIYLNFGKTLRIYSVDFQDEGTYECIASNGVGTQESNTMDVRVESVPFWKIHPNNTNIDEGESVSFECFAEGVPEPELRWFINGEPLENYAPNSRRKLDGNILTIEKLVKDDTAVYQCNATNTHGYAFKDFYLNVLAFPPTFIVGPMTSTRAFITSTATLTCRVFGAPKPEIHWYRDDSELKDGLFYVSGVGDLLILNASQNDVGRYECRASNKFGNASAFVDLQVEAMVSRSSDPLCTTSVTVIASIFVCLIGYYLQ